MVGFIYSRELKTLIKNYIEEKYQEKEFYWQSGVSGTSGYPIYVSTGGFNHKSMHSTFGGKSWGSPSYAWAAGEDPLPTRLSCEWVSFTESEEQGKVYRISTNIDYEKIRKLFEKGYDLIRESGKIEHKNFWVITAGFAPGGTVIVWVDGAGRCEEIGRYQGYEVSKDTRDLHKETLEKLEPDWRDYYLNNSSVVKTDVRARTKGKPIPYGLWDSLRERFNYNIIFKYPDNSKPVRISTQYGNGEFKYTYYQEGFKNSFIQNNEAVPLRITHLWRSGEEKKLVANVFFEEEYILNVFKRMSAHNPKASLELIIRFNEVFDYYTVRIKNSEGREEFVKVSPYEEIEIFETTKED